MEKRRKKTYYKPGLSIIHMDKDVTMIMMSPLDEKNPPAVFESSSSNSTSSSDETTKKSTKENNFDENPFER